VQQEQLDHKDLPDHLDQQLLGRPDRLDLQVRLDHKDHKDHKEQPDHKENKE
jgi:hypothetical protein